jgi:hypothetical protein
MFAFGTFVILGGCLGFGTWDLGFLITIAAFNEADVRQLPAI